MIEEFRGANPGATPSDLFFLIGAEYPIGAFSRKIAQRKSEQGRAPGYLYRFDWETPIAGGRMKSPHALEITFVFDHAGEPLAPRLAPDSPEVHALAADDERAAGSRSRAPAIPTPATHRTGPRTPPTSARR